MSQLLTSAQLTVLNTDQDHAPKNLGQDHFKIFASKLPIIFTPFFYKKRVSELFFNHVRKFHMKLDGNVEMNPRISLTFLVENMKVEDNLSMLQCSECGFMCQGSSDAMMDHFRSQHHHDSDIGLFICRICNDVKECHVSLEKLMEKLRLHRSHFEHFVQANTYWQCKECESLSKCCMTFNIELAVFHNHNLTITRKCNADDPEKNVWFKYSCNDVDPSRDCKVFQCPVCLLAACTFYTEAQLESHLESHMDSALTMCMDCPHDLEYNNRFLGPVGNRNEMVTTRSEIFHCPICKSNLESNRRTIFTHLLRCTMKRSLQVKNNKDENYERHENLCFLCGHVSSKLNLLFDHVRFDCHLMKSENQCKFCLQFFLSKLNLVFHLLHTKCTHCGLVLCDAKRLENHVKTCIHIYM